jgi:hypothetical protein
VSSRSIKQDLNTVVGQDTLLHGKAVLINTTGDLEDVTLELVTDSVTGNLLRDTLVIEDTTMEQKRKKKNRRRKSETGGSGN